MKFGKLYIDFTGWRRQEELCDAVNSPAIIKSDCLDPLLTPSCVKLFWTVTNIWTMTTLSDAIISNAQNTLDRHVYHPLPPLVLLLTPSLRSKWRRQVLFPARKIKTLPFSSLLCSKNVQNASFSRFHSKSTLNDKRNDLGQYLIK
jgi:hypothetical protein